jgi:cob(I)alamin adenosyltransferase
LFITPRIGLKGVAVLKAYTGTGDKGETGLYDGTRLWKNDRRVEAYGAVDELNSQIGVVRALVKMGTIDDILRTVQRELFMLGGDLATTGASSKVPRIGRANVTSLEQTVDDIHVQLEPLHRFILPAGGMIASELHLARSVCRRAERRVVALARAEQVNPEVVPYLNRLSTLLFDLARLANRNEGVSEEEWVHAQRER